MKTPQQGWSVELGGVEMDVAFFDADMGVTQVRKSLIEHDGYSPDIAIHRVYYGEDGERLERGTETLADYRGSLERSLAGIAEWRSAMEHLANALTAAAETLRNYSLAEAIDNAATQVRDLAANPPVSEADLRLLSGERDAQAAQLVRELRQEQEGGGC